MSWYYFSGIQGDDIRYLMIFEIQTNALWSFCLVTFDCNLLCYQPIVLYISSCKAVLDSLKLFMHFFITECQDKECYLLMKTGMLPWGPLFLPWLLDSTAGLFPTLSTWILELLFMIYRLFQLQKDCFQQASLVCHG